MILKMKNVDGSDLSILGVYAPNRPYQNAAFWRDIKAWHVAHPNVDRPDILGGDTNFVEDVIDRLPLHPDSKTSMDAFDDLKQYLGLIDGEKHIPRPAHTPSCRSLAGRLPIPHRPNIY
jgi:hypothetical protein